MATLTSLLLRPELWLGIILVALFLVLVAWRRRLAWWPAWLLRVLLAALVLLGVFSSTLDFEPHTMPQRQVMVVDLSDSLSGEARLQAWQQAVAWQQAAPEGAAGEANRAIVVAGVDSAPVLPGATGGAEPPAVDGRASDLAGALRRAGTLLSGTPAADGPAGKIILATDGLAVQPVEVGAVVAELTARGHTLDVLPLTPRPTEGDLAVGALTAPKNLWAGTGFDLLVPVYGAAGGGAGALRLAVNGQESPVQAEALGEGLYRFRVPSLPEGIVTLEVSAGLEGPEGADPFPGNNRASAVLQVFPPPRVLFVSAEPAAETVSRFVQALGQHGVEVDTVLPEGLPTNLENLRNYRVIFLDDLLSSQLSREQMQALQVFVSRLAGGLVFLGGRNSYTLGGYQDTLLEPMLPVHLEAPPRAMRPPIAFQLTFDRSSSMEIDRSRDDPPPIALAREAAMRLIETLRVEDYLGVLSFSHEKHWDVPLGPLGSEQGIRQALDAVGRVEAFGGTRMYEAMEEAVASMVQLPAGAPANRHILILSDGQSADGTDDEFRALAESARAQGVTISAISLGNQADAELMAQIAEAGKGRFYAVEDASDLPRILISESEAARSENVQTGDTSLKMGEGGHPILSGLRQQQLPTLTGYNALRSKAEEGAEDVLVSASFGDPVLSTWQYGLGRVVAWTGDTGEEWTGSWPGDVEGRFWSQVVRYALVDPGLSPAQVSVQVEPAQVVVEAAIYTADGDPANLSEVFFTYVGAENETKTYRLAQRGAGLYRVEIPRPAEGAYRAVLSYTGEDGQPAEAAAPFVVNPPAEWLPPDPSTGAANLTAWAEIGRGQLTSAEALLAPADETDERARNGADDWWWRLLLALVILWPLEIAIRRRWLPWV